MMTLPHGMTVSAAVLVLLQPAVSLSGKTNVLLTKPVFVVADRGNALSGDRPCPRDAPLTLRGAS